MALVASVAAQSVPSFETASVKRNTSGELRAIIAPQPGGRFTATNVPLRTLIAAAFGFPLFRVTGGPDWIDAARFDIVAKGSTPTPQAGGGPSVGVFSMLRSLLIDRFKVSARTETREQPIYTLVLAKGPDVLGPRLRRSTLDCAALRA